MVQTPVYIKQDIEGIISLGQVSRYCCVKGNGMERPLPRVMHIDCEECTAVSGKYIYLCNNKLKDSNILCHVKYHNHYSKKHKI